MADREIFRKVSLERLSSPERLDVLTEVTTSFGWLALCALGLLVLMSLTWGWAGSIPVTVRGEGMLVNRGGVTNVVTLGSGQVTELFVKPNDTVQAGQAIATIAQPLASTDVKNAQAELHELRQQHEKLVRFAKNDLDLQVVSIKAQQETLQHSISGLEKKGDFYRSQLEKQIKLKEKGLLIPAKVEATRQEIAGITEQIESLKVKLTELKTQENLSRNRAQDMVAQSANKISVFERNIAAMTSKVTIESNVISSISGKVVEIKVAKGTVVSAGTPVLSLEHGEKQLEGIIYISEADGKKIRPGMKLDVIPSSVRREEHGSMVGTVQSVSEYPASAAGIMTVLGNEQLVQRLMRNGAPYTAYVELQSDSSSANGFKWTSGKGPSTPIVSGTLCAAQVTVERRRPLGLVIPFLKKSMGL
ncbi:MAG TPA: NHLP bacteriocin system secretion protein [Desulfuromonadales bacterium]|nr:NHLP bacteriocin system secretion protein [Desulfuromonadales bacterium]